MRTIILKKTFCQFQGALQRMVDELTQKCHKSIALLKLVRRWEKSVTRVLTFGF